MLLPPTTLSSPSCPEPKSMIRSHPSSSARAVAHSLCPGNPFKDAKAPHWPPTSWEHVCCLLSSSSLGLLPLILSHVCVCMLEVVHACVCVCVCQNILGISSHTTSSPSVTPTGFPAYATHKLLSVWSQLPPKLSILFHVTMNTMFELQSNSTLHSHHYTLKT